MYFREKVDLKVFDLGAACLGDDLDRVILDDRWL